jgi:hypothetical protein
MGGAELLKPSYAHNMRLIGHSDQAGRSDGQQIMVRNGDAYIGADWSGAGLYIMECAG